MEAAKYNCPRCNIAYCSVNCYRSTTHLQCSEQFYRECIEEDLAASGPGEKHSKEDIRKVYEILQRIRETEAGEEFQPSSESLDSDDDQDVTANKRLERESDEGTDEEDEDLCERLKNIDINDAGQVWSQLTAKEKKEFETLLSTGDIMKLVPSFTPWWLSLSSKRPVEETQKDLLPSRGEGTSVVHPSTMPSIISNISKFSDLCRKEPAASVHYNLWNILASYACTVRFFAGEHCTVPNEASACLLNLSTCLKYGTNFDDVEDALLSVEMEAKTTGQDAVQQLFNCSNNKSFDATMTCGTFNATLVEDRSKLESDVCRLMLSTTYKLAALSDILNLFRLARKFLKKKPQTNCREKDRKDNVMDFHKLFALNGGGVELTTHQLCQLIRKIQFYLSYVNRSNLS